MKSQTILKSDEQAQSKNRGEEGGEKSNKFINDKDSRGWGEKKHSPPSTKTLIISRPARVVKRNPSVIVAQSTGRIAFCTSRL